MSSYIAGIDAGLTNTGVVILDLDAGIQIQSLIQADSNGAKRLYDIEVALDRILRPYTLSKDLVIFLEGYAYNAKYQRESLAELGGVLRRYFYVHRYPYWVVPPLLLKQFVSGTSRANKNYMKKCTKEKWGQIFKSDDVCDAYGLARLGREVIHHKNIPLDVTRFGDEHEQRVIGEILYHTDHYFEPNTAYRGKKKPCRKI